MTMGLALAAVVAAVLGWVGGMWTFKRSQQWCPTCGGSLTCAACRSRTRAAAGGPDTGTGR